MKLHSGTLKTSTAENSNFAADTLPIRQFFALASSYFCLQEGTAQHREYQLSTQEIADQITGITNYQTILSELAAYSDDLWPHKITDITDRNFEYFVAQLQIDEQYIDLSWFDRTHQTDAIAQYNDQETQSILQATTEQKSLSVPINLLGYVRSIAQVRKAFPNYFGGTRDFLDRLTPVLYKQIS